jgi:hypothetical protein
VFARQEVAMADVFVSYSREDKARAAGVVHLLESAGWDVFWDQETRSGTLWPKVLERELGAARCLVVLWTVTSIDSRWVRIEAYEALQHDKLLPILLDDVQPPLEFRQTQTLDMVGWDGVTDDERVRRLLDDLRALIETAPAEAPARPPRVVVPTIRREAVQLAEQPTSTVHDAAPQRGAHAPPSSPVEDNAATTTRKRRRALLASAGLVAAIAAGWALPRFMPEPSHLPSKPDPVPGPTTPPPGPNGSGTGGSPVSPNAPSPSGPAKRSVAKPGGTLAAKPSAQLSDRCFAINDKVQQGGQLSAAELELLRSQECPR